MSKTANTVVYFDWKTVIYIYVCGKGRTQFMLTMEKSVTFTGACANAITPSINRSLVYKAKEGRDARIVSWHLWIRNSKINFIILIAIFFQGSILTFFRFMRRLHVNLNIRTLFCLTKRSQILITYWFTWKLITFVFH